MKKRMLVPLFLLIMATMVSEGSDALLARLAPGTNLVYDFAGVFQPAQKAELENILRGVEQKTTAEIAVVALRSLEGGEINDFANRLFAKWGIGKKDKDNGLLLLAAIEDRKVRIEVGYGLEGALPDAKTGRMLDEYVIPEFKQQKYAEGLIAGAVALAGDVAREAGVELEVPTEMQPQATGQNPVVGLLVFGIFAGLIALLVVAAKKGWIKSTGSSTGSRSGGRFGGGSGGGSSFGGGSSGGGGASRGW
jgi:uncharacterized protein